MIRENKIIGRAKLGDKYRREIWEIEEILNQECGLYRIRPGGYTTKVMHRKNLRPVNWGEGVGNEELDLDSSENEMPDMAEVLGRFGIDATTWNDTKCKDSESIDECESEVEVLPIPRRSERLKRKICKGERSE